MHRDAKLNTKNKRISRRMYKSVIKPIVVFGYVVWIMRNEETYKIWGKTNFEKNLWRESRERYVEKRSQQDDFYMSFSRSRELWE